MRPAPALPPSQPSCGFVDGGSSHFNPPSPPSEHRARQQSVRARPGGPSTRANAPFSPFHGQKKEGVSLSRKHKICTHLFLPTPQPRNQPIDLAGRRGGRGAAATDTPLPSPYGMLVPYRGAPYPAVTYHPHPPPTGGIWRPVVRGRNGATRPWPRGLHIRAWRVWLEGLAGRSGWKAWLEGLGVDSPCYAPRGPMMRPMRPPAEKRVLPLHAAGGHSTGIANFCHFLQHISRFRFHLFDPRFSLHPAGPPGSPAT